MRTIICLTVCLFAAPAFADVTLAYDDGAGKPQYTLFIKGDHMRMETHGDDGGVVLFDATKQEMVIVDDSRRQYMKFDEATLARLQAQMKQALEMATRFGMDPAQLGLGGGGDEPVTVKTGETKTVNGHRCTVERYEVGDLVDGIACIATPKEVGISDADWRTMERMFRMLTQMAEDMMPSDFGGLDMPAPDGIAVEASAADGSDRQVLSKIEHGAIDAAKFAVPSGYKRLEMPSLGG